MDWDQYTLSDDDVEDSVDKQYERTPKARFGAAVLVGALLLGVFSVLVGVLCAAVAHLQKVL